jgi:glutamine---fructose-6-phosphate transaminase (isomerizing)
MCSIVGYIGRKYCRAFILEGLKRLEYRGYDSAGFGCLDPRDGRLLYLKAAGTVDNLLKKFADLPIDGFVGFGHTRWATHGLASEHNAHPHFDCDKRLAVVHNGIIENYHELKQELEGRGHVFLSDTDTEVIAHLTAEMFDAHQHIRDQAELIRAVTTKVVARLEGAYAFAFVVEQFPDCMVLVRRRSPLCIGVSENEMFVASDIVAFTHKTQRVIFMPDESCALVRECDVELWNFSGHSLSHVEQNVTPEHSVYDKEGHEHFMLKEIYEQKDAIAQTLEFLQSVSTHIWDYLGMTGEQACAVESLTLVGCGPSWHASRIAQFFFEEVCRIPVRVIIASEFDPKTFFSDAKSLYLAVSESGETAEVLDVVRSWNESGVFTIAITNVASSTLVREAGGFLLTRAGRGVAAAATQGFSTQLAVLFWFAHRLAYEKRVISLRDLEMAEAELLVAAEVLENSIENYKFDIIHRLAPFYAQYKKSIFLGRGIGYPFAMEAALKLKEVSYIFTQCCPAGELQHGTLIVVDEQTPVFIFSHEDHVLYKKLVADAQEIKARNGHIVAFAFEGQDDLVGLADLSFVIPRVHRLLGPLAMTGLMHFFFYHIAKHLERPIDRPRDAGRYMESE